MSAQDCILCNEVGGRLIWQNDLVRIINADDTYYPAFTRVIHQAHIKEMTELSPEQRHKLMDFVYLVEEVQRQVLQPVKINLAQFGTMVPHIHWHIIPRFNEDPHYPDAIWSIAKYNQHHKPTNSYITKQQELLAHYESTLVNRLKLLYK